MNDQASERRHYLRVCLDLPVAIHQGGSIWSQRLIDLSVTGLSTDQPETWDAQYNEPFTLMIDAGRHGELELHAWLQHVEAGCLGFTVQSVDSETRAALRALMDEHVHDGAALDAEFAKLD